MTGVNRARPEASMSVVVETYDEAVTLAMEAFGKVFGDTPFEIFEVELLPYLKAIGTDLPVSWAATVTAGADIQTPDPELHPVHGK